MPEPPNVYSFFNSSRNSMVAERARLAGTSKERRNGLLGERALAEGQGLWIVPCEAIHTFGMSMIIDSLFLDKQLRVRCLRSNLKPRRIAVSLQAHSVLELPAGTIARSKTRVGDQLVVRECCL